MPGREADSDEALARSVQQGDRSALERLVRRYIRPVHAVAASFLTETDQIEDAAQDTFVRALHAIDRYDPDRPFAPWLYQIARNVARNALAGRTARRTEPLRPGPTGDPAPLPDVAAERAEIRARVDAAVARLPEQRRIAFRLVDVEGIPAEETGRIMGISAGTVRSHVHHARRQLREGLAEYAAEAEDHSG